MVRSMTGFGQASRSIAGYTVQIDVKSVNHRYCEVQVRMPREWLKYEDLLKRAVQQEIKRGRIDVFVTVEKQTDAAGSMEIDWPLADAYRQAAEQLKVRFGLEGSLTVQDFLRIPELITMQETAAIPDEEAEQVWKACINDALKQLIRMRESEGGHLAADTTQRVETMASLLEQARILCPQSVQEYALKLRSRIQELIQQPVIDEVRLATEVAIFADRANVDEELTRLQSHFQQCRQLLQSAEPIGRKFDFLVQEMNREVNTIGSKANHAGLTALVVEMKAELEKMREQIQNIE
ncbi:YicC family protein [Paenibacillus sp. H1-7]|uniref:YicC/YloC family endoribonuclease n=1 Tax=Paenibacillus sp. H1-7 TaxID=2282849 RepID=UPI001EF80A14|nr:YicC/YloC family endoribonuclease [Paenibacillus sp. H1-7]ULL17416.1 YicC family protein [Paenibacillus sp. H1-7]